jgi:hypothetical protein
MATIPLSSVPDAIQELALKVRQSGELVEIVEGDDVVARLLPPENAELARRREDHLAAWQWLDQLRPRVAKSTLEQIKLDIEFGRR